MDKVNVNQEQIFGHPKGLFVLFFTEMWERFSYYGMRAILVLFLVAKSEDGGMGWDKPEALILYGVYTALVYVMAIPGGILADRYLGQKKSVLLGAVLLVIGPLFLTLEGFVPSTLQATFFFTGLGIIILGVGALKPNISTMVGSLYHPKDNRRDMGFTIFYIGINLGAFLSGLIVASVAANFGWHFGFGVSAIGMILGLIVYTSGQKYLEGVDVKVNEENKQLKNSSSSQALSKKEKDRLVVLSISFLVVIVFWGAFEQAGGLMNIYAQEKVNRFVGDFEIPAGWFQSVNSLYIMIFGTLVAAFWVRWGKMGRESSSLFKMAVGTIIMGLGFLFMIGATHQLVYDAQGEIVQKASMMWLFGAYFLHTIGELCLSPVALSFVTRLAPAKYTSMVMGVFFAMTGFGNLLAGSLGALSASLGDEEIFKLIVIVSVGVGVVLLAFLSKLKKLTHGADNESSYPSKDLEGELDLQQ